MAHLLAAHFLACWLASLLLLAAGAAAGAAGAAAWAAGAAGDAERSWQTARLLETLGIEGGA